MKHHDFSTGTEFRTAAGRWRCTDVGQRTIIAIKLDHDDDPSWYNGPPYAVAETVFNEYDFAACRRAPRRMPERPPSVPDTAPWDPATCAFATVRRARFPNLKRTVVPTIYSDPPTRSPLLGRLIRELMEAYDLTPMKLAIRVFPLRLGRSSTHRKPSDERSRFSQAERRKVFSEWITTITSPHTHENDFAGTAHDLLALDRVFGFEPGYFAHVHADDFARGRAATDATDLADIRPLNGTTTRQRALRDFSPTWRSRFER